MIRERLRHVCALMLLCGMSCLSAQAQEGARLLDGFEDASAWRVLTSNQVSGRLRTVEGVTGRALCLDYDFNGVSGYASLQRDLPMEYPDNYRFSFRLRGDSPANDLQFKLFDQSGDNVWWVNRPRHAFPATWTPVVYKRRHIGKAWGPSKDPVMRASARLEFTIYNQVGGKGSVCFDDLTFEPLPADDTSPLDATATAQGTRGDSDARRAVDEDPATAWEADAARATLTLDLQRPREFGGLRLDWARDRHATDYAIDLSDDGRAWRMLRDVRGSNGGRDYIALPESQARYLRLRVQRGAAPRIALQEARVQPLAFAATPNDLLESIAADRPRGWFPRGFIGEQPYWTLVGVDGGREQGLIGEDGAIELRRGAPSIVPFVQVADADGSSPSWVTWADVETSLSLQDGYLPMPQVEWTRAEFSLGIAAFAQEQSGRSRLIGRYRLTNTGAQPRQFTLALALMPYQVNPPSQFLNTTGGYSPIRRLSLRDGRVLLNGDLRIDFDPSGHARASTFDAGLITERLARNEPRSSAQDAPIEIHDADGLASAVQTYTVTLQPGQSFETHWLAPWEGELPVAFPFDAAAAQREVADGWRDTLDRVRIRVPAEGQALIDTLRTSLAHMLISRIGPRLQPGTRSYSRSWIRDGAMISEGLLRMGREDVARDYVQWYAPYQFKDGMVPCCVDDRGSDPVPENDSHGELIYAIAEYYRYTGDRAFLRSMWPHVQGAFGYMETLRLSERTDANRARNGAFYGMMPVSISHEGYSAKPMHSYWDNFWALRGYKDAAELAGIVGDAKQRRTMAAARDQFRADLDASLRAATRAHGIDYLPGAAELGDFDPTSTTIALAPGGEQGRLPADLVNNTFERYWREFAQRRDGQREWKDYTPYEWRNVAAFVRLGWRERAWEAIDFFFRDRRPQEWNQWGEVVSRTPRTPFFLGDLPHAWVGSDFVRSALDMFAYTREVDASIVIAAGVLARWLDGEGISVEGLRTPYGPLGYRLQRSGAQLRLEMPAGLRMPEGGIVLPWPLQGAPGRTTINGRAASWRNGELRIRELPAQVNVELR